MGAATATAAPADAPASNTHAAVPLPSLLSLAWRAVRTRQRWAQLRLCLARARACRRCQRLNDGCLLFEGVFARAASMTQNGRVYSKASLAREVRAYVLRPQHACGACGRFGHPSPARGGGYGAAVAPQHASHRVLRLRWAGDTLHGVLEVLPTPSGAALAAAFVAGAGVGVSTRGFAQLQQHTTDAARVDDDWQLVAFDVVVAPATPDAALAPCAAALARQPGTALQLEDDDDAAEA